VGALARSYWTWTSTPVQWLHLAAAILLTFIMGLDLVVAQLAASASPTVSWDDWRRMYMQIEAMNAVLMAGCGGMLIMTMVTLGVLQ